MNGEEQKPRRARILDQGTLVPVSVVVVGFGLAFWLNAKFADLTLDVADIRKDVKVIQRQLEVPLWTVRDMKTFARGLQSSNPKLLVPEVD